MKLRLLPPGYLAPEFSFQPADTNAQVCLLLLDGELEDSEEYLFMAELQPLLHCRLGVKRGESFMQIIAGGQIPQ